VRMTIWMDMVFLLKIRKGVNRYKHQPCGTPRLPTIIAAIVVLFVLPIHGPAQVNPDFPIYPASLSRHAEHLVNVSSFKTKRPGICRASMRNRDFFNA